jgi:hypothetical protein
MQLQPTQAAVREIQLDIDCSNRCRVFDKHLVPGLDVQCSCGRNDDRLNPGPSDGDGYRVLLTFAKHQL